MTDFLLVRLENSFGRLCLKLFHHELCRNLLELSNITIYSFMNNLQHLYNICLVYVSENPFSFEFSVCIPSNFDENLYFNGT